MHNLDKTWNVDLQTNPLKAHYLKKHTLLLDSLRLWFGLIDKQNRFETF